LPLESPVAVLADASPSMEVAIRTATILSSLLTAICTAKLTFFHHRSVPPQFIPKTVEDVLSLAILTKVEHSTAPAVGLAPYYEGKEIIKTFVIVTDEEENTRATLEDGTDYPFYPLFMKYREEVYPAKLVFISFLSQQHAEGQMYRQFVRDNVPDILQFKFNRQRPDLTKIDSLLGLLSTGKFESFENNVEPLQNQFAESGIDSVMTSLLEKTPENKQIATMDTT
ncbi:unnamed protein product, partial [Didymodactylos carnosus]